MSLDTPLDSPRPARERYSVPPASPLVAVDRIDTPPNFLHVLADVAAQQAYILSPQLQYPPANEAQDAYVHLQFEEVVDRVPLADIPVENLPPAVVEAPVAVVPSPAPPTPVLQELPLPVVPLLSRVKPAPSHTQANTRTSQTAPALKPSYSQVTKLRIRARDPGKQHVTGARDRPRDRGT